MESDPFIDAIAKKKPANAFEAMMTAPKKVTRVTPSGYSVVHGTSDVDDASCHLLQFDGLSDPNPGISSGGAVLFAPKTRDMVSERGEYIEYATNNEAEYTGLIIGLSVASDLGVKYLLVEGDSQLVIYQTEGKWKVKHDNMKRLQARVQELLKTFDYVAVRHVYRDKNEYADRITNIVRQTKRSYSKIAQSAMGYMGQ